MVKIALCIKQVPDTSDIKWTEHNTIRREGVESIINPYDVFALNTALDIKKSCEDSEITVLTMGPAQAEEMLKKAIAVGADKGALISDRKFAGADTYATGKTLAKSIQTIVSDYDLVICGQFAIDGDTAQTGPSIANHLGLAQVTYVKEFIECGEDYVIVRRQADDGVETVKVKLPALLCVSEYFKAPARATINGIKKAQFSDVKTYSLDDIGLTPDEVGIKGSPTYVSKAFRPIVEHNCEKINFSKENLSTICDRINEYKAGQNG